MTLQSAAGLLWLIPLAGVIIALYLLKMRRRDLRVPATFLWPARTEEIRANTLFQRLRFSWLLLLQLLALALVLFALARPQTMQEGLAGRVTVLVIDASASMGATDVSPSRFEHAKRVASGAVASAETGDRIAIVEAGPVPRVISSLSNDALRLRRALNDLRQYDSEADVGGALRLAASLVGKEPFSRIVLLSDGAFERVQDFTQSRASLVYQTIGKSSDNLAVTALGTAETPAGRQLFVGVRSFASRPMEATITVTADGQPIDSEKTTVPAGRQWGKTVAAPSGAKVLQAKITAPQDTLSADNRAVALVSPGASLRVLLVGPGDFFLERAIVLDPRVTLYKAASLPAAAGEGYDVVVFDGVAEGPVNARGVLAFGVAGSSSPVNPTGALTQPLVTSQERHPLLEGVDLRDMYIGRAQRVAPKPTGEVIARSGEVPLVVVSATPAQRQVFMAFQPMQSDFPLQVGFPIFIANALTYLGGEGESNALSVRAGAPFALVTRSSVTVRSSEGTVKIEPSGGSVVVRDLRRVGDFTIEVAGQKKAVYASLRSDIESDIQPKPKLLLGSGEVQATRAPARYADFWRPLLLVALLVLAIEWWVFARRS